MPDGFELPSWHGGSLDASRAHLAHGLEWSGGRGWGGCAHRDAHAIAAALHTESTAEPRLSTAPSSGCTQISLPKRNFFLPLQNNYAEELKKTKQTACPFVPVDVNNTRNTIILWLSSSIISPEIAWVVLIMFVPFLSALVISWVPRAGGRVTAPKSLL